MKVWLKVDWGDWLLGVRWHHASLTKVHCGPIALWVQHRKIDFPFENHLLWRTTSQRWRIYMGVQPFVFVWGVSLHRTNSLHGGNYNTLGLYLGWIDLTVSNDEGAQVANYVPRPGLFNRA